MQQESTRHASATDAATKGQGEDHCDIDNGWCGQRKRHLDWCWCDWCDADVVDIAAVAVVDSLLCLLSLPFILVMGHDSDDNDDNDDNSDNEYIMMMMMMMMLMLAVAVVLVLVRQPMKRKHRPLSCSASGQSMDANGLANNSGSFGPSPCPQQPHCQTLQAFIYRWIWHLYTIVYITFVWFQKLRTQSWQKLFTVLPLIQVGSSCLPYLYLKPGTDNVSPARCHPKHDHCYQKPDQTWLPIRMNNFWYKDCFAFSSHLDSMSHKRAHFLAVFFCSRSSLDCMWNMLGPDSCHIISWGRCDCEVDKRSAQLSFSAGPCKWKGYHTGSTNWYQGMANGFGHYIIYILLTSVLTHSIIWLEYGFLCVLFKTIYSMPLPFHLFDYFLQVLDFASLASEKKRKCSLPALAFKTMYRGLEFGLTKQWYLPQDLVHLATLLLQASLPHFCYVLLADLVHLNTRTCRECTSMLFNYNMILIT